MFPDRTLQWQPYPSELDGIKAPFVLDKGLWKGVLHLIVLECQPGRRAYGIEIDCEIYAGFEEKIYSMAEHGEGAPYDGDVYIKEASSSGLISAYTKADYLGKVPRHFLLVGTDYCYECLGFFPPTIRAFASESEAYGWGPPQG